MPSLAVIIPVGPNHKAIVNNALTSVKAATDASTVFDLVKHFVVDDTQGLLGRNRARNQGLDSALKENFDWVCFLDADDVLFNDAFTKLEEHLENRDAIWGLIAEFMHGQPAMQLRPNQLIECHSVKELLCCDPSLSLKMGFFARAKCFSSIRFDDQPNAAADFTLYLQLWDSFNCIKASIPLVASRRGAPIPRARKRQIKSNGKK